MDSSARPASHLSQNRPDNSDLGVSSSVIELLVPGPDLHTGTVGVAIDAPPPRPRAEAGGNTQIRSGETSHRVKLPHRHTDVEALKIAQKVGNLLRRV